MFPKHCVLPQSGNILFKYPLQISPARFRPGTGSFLSAGNYLPCPGTQHRTDKRAYNENPQLAQSLSTLKERRAYTASRINRSTGITDAGQMYKYQRETYGKSGKITGALLGIGSAQYHQYKHKCKQSRPVGRPLRKLLPGRHWRLFRSHPNWKSAPKERQNLK